MRRYDDPVEVRKGMVGGPGGRVEGPEQFLWRGRLWKVRDVLAHWVETGPWWQSSGVQAGLGADRPDLPELPEPGDPADPADPGERDGVLALRQDLLAEREVWRVEAGRGQVGQPRREPGGQLGAQLGGQLGDQLGGQLGGQPAGTGVF